MSTIAKVRRERYISSPAPHVSADLETEYTGQGLVRREILTREASSDLSTDAKIRYSYDNGKTWSDWKDDPSFMSTQGRLTLEEMEFARVFDPTSGKMVRMLFQRLLPPNLQESLANDTYYDHQIFQISDDDGMTWDSGQLLQYEEGDPFDPNNWDNPGYLTKNGMYGGYNILPMSNGDLLYAASVTMPFKNKNGVAESVCGIYCFSGHWDKDLGNYTWTRSEPIAVSKDISSRGLMEACLAELSDGRILLELRGSCTEVTPGRKWISVSSDHGFTWTDPTDFKYDDGEQFYAPSAFAKMLRSSKTGKLYWIGNITPTPPNASLPRYPLLIAEVDETIPALKRSTVTVIDDYNPEKDTNLLQLSNFGVFENRETQEIEIYLTRFGENGQNDEIIPDFWTAHVYKYVLTLL